MDIKDAIDVAKKYVAEVFQDEGIKNIGLEEIDLDESRAVWFVTIGFSRPWDEPRGSAFLYATGQNQYARRSYKVVRVSDKTGQVLSIKNREDNS